MYTNMRVLHPFPYSHYLYTYIIITKTLVVACFHSKLRTLLFHLYGPTSAFDWCRRQVPSSVARDWLTPLRWRHRLRSSDVCALKAFAARGFSSTRCRLRVARHSSCSLSRKQNAAQVMTNIVLFGCETVIDLQWSRSQESFLWSGSCRFQSITSFCL